jgi:hypothetical protein
MFNGMRALAPIIKAISNYGQRGGRIAADATSFHHSRQPRLSALMFMQITHRHAGDRHVRGTSRKPDYANGTTLRTRHPHALNRFEPEKGFRFATYAKWWIKASIQDCILRSWSLVNDRHHCEPEETPLQTAHRQKHDCRIRKS